MREIQPVVPCFLQLIYHLASNSRPRRLSIYLSFVLSFFFDLSLSLSLCRFCGNIFSNNAIWSRHYLAMALAISICCTPSPGQAIEPFISVTLERKWKDMNAKRKEKACKWKKMKRRECTLEWTWKEYEKKKKGNREMNRNDRRTKEKLQNMNATWKEYACKWKEHEGTWIKRNATWKEHEVLPLPKHLKPTQNNSSIHFRACLGPGMDFGCLLDLEYADFHKP